MNADVAKFLSIRSLAGATDSSHTHTHILFESSAPCLFDRKMFVSESLIRTLDFFFLQSREITWITSSNKWSLFSFFFFFLLRAPNAVGPCYILLSLDNSWAFIFLIARAVIHWFKRLANAKRNPMLQYVFYAHHRHKFIYKHRQTSQSTNNFWSIWKRWKMEL